MTVRICHVCSAHRDDDARVFERQCVSLAQSGYDSHLLARSEHGQPFVRAGVIIHPVPTFASRRARIFGRRRIAEMAAGLKPDLFHVHEPELLGAVLKVAKGRPVIWDVHEIYLDEIRAKHWIPAPLRPLVGFAWDRLERSMVRRCAAVIPVTEWLAPRYRALHRRVVVIANFPRLPMEIERASVLRRTNSLVFTGTIAPNRGVVDVIQAMAILKHKGISIFLELAGTPINQQYLDELMQKARELKVEQDIRFHGHLTREKTIALQQTCGIGLVVHLSSEGNAVGYPVKMFEFMMYGLPLIYSDLPMFQRVAGESQAGLAVACCQPQQVADAIERLLTDPALAQRLGENGRRAIYERFNWNLEWPKLRDLYADLVGRAGTESLTPTKVPVHLSE